MVERLPPGVEDGGDADGGTEMLGIGRDGEQRLGRCLEQQGIDRRLVLVGDGADRCRQGEDDVVVGDWQQIGLARRKPRNRRPPLALRAVAVATGVECNERMGAVLASLDVTAERRRAAGFDCRHDA